jgi:hypothetical protein
MSSSTKREVSHDQREIEPIQRRSSRLNRKLPGIHSRKFSTPTEATMPKMVKSSSPTEKAKLETLYSPNKGSPKVIKSHEDSENSNNNHTFLPKPDFEGYRNNDKKEFEENQNYVGNEKFHQEPDHPITFMKMVKERTRTMSAVNDERRQVLPSKVI